MFKYFKDVYVETEEGQIEPYGDLMLNTSKITHLLSSTVSVVELDGKISEEPACYIYTDYDTVFYVEQNIEWVGSVIAGNKVSVLR